MLENKRNKYHLKKTTRIIDKKNYLKCFDSKKYGSLHKQQFIKQEITNYITQLKKFKQYYCINCKELWLNTANKCATCTSKPNKVLLFN